jgi:hypothetical protein
MSVGSVLMLGMLGSPRLAGKSDRYHRPVPVLTGPAPTSSPPTVTSATGPQTSSTRSPQPDPRTDQQVDRRIPDFAGALGHHGAARC